MRTELISVHFTEMEKGQMKITPSFFWFMRSSEMQPREKCKETQKEIRIVPYMHKTRKESQLYLDFFGKLTEAHFQQPGNK